MIKKIISLFLAIFFVLPLGGCWSRKELNELAIIMAAGIDRAPNNQILLTLQIARPSAFSSGSQKSGTQNNNTWVIAQTGETVMDAERYLDSKISRRLYWGHDIILIFGEQLARDGLNQVIDYFSRSPEVRETPWVLLAKGKASDVINSHSQLENTSAQSVGDIARTGTIMPVMLKDLMMDLASYGTNPVIPGIELTPSGTPQGPEMLENIPEANGENQKATKVHAEVTATGTGVFKNDKLVGWLDLKDTRGLLWLRNKMKKDEITVNSKTEPNKHISVRVDKANTEIKPFYDGNNVWFNVNITAECELLEQQSNEKLTDKKYYKAIEKEVSDQITLRTREALDQAQHVYGVDMFSFGEAFHRKYKKDWATMKNNWDEIFASAEVNIKTRATIRRTGLNTNKPNARQ